MIKMLVPALLGLSLMAGSVTPASAAPCKDAKGRFVKCLPKAPVKKAPCKDAKGRFISCK